MKVYDGDLYTSIGYLGFQCITCCQLSCAIFRTLCVADNNQRISPIGVDVGQWIIVGVREGAEQLRVLRKFVGLTRQQRFGRNKLACTWIVVARAVVVQVGLL